MEMRDEIDRSQRPIKSANDPAALVWCHAILVRQDSLRPHARVVAIYRKFADGLTDEILWLLYATRSVDIDCGVPKTAVREHWEGNERGIVEVESAEIVRHPQLRNVEMTLTYHALENVRDDKGTFEGGIDAVELHCAIEQRTHAVILIGPNSKFEIVHYRISLIETPSVHP